MEMGKGVDTGAEGRLFVFNCFYGSSPRLNLLSSFCCCCCCCCFSYDVLTVFVKQLKDCVDDVWLYRVPS